MKKLISRPALWYLTATALFLFFLFYTSLKLYHDFGFFLAMVEAAIFGGVIYFGKLQEQRMLESLHPTEEENVESEDVKEYNQWGMILIPFFCAFLGMFVLFAGWEAIISHKIKKEGIFAKAKIIDGQSVISQSLRRRSESYSILLEFESPDGQLHQGYTKVSDEVYYSLAKGLEVEIKYLPDEPTIFKIMVGNENVQQYKNVTNRNLTFADIEKLSEIQHSEFAFFLNNISSGWNHSATEEGDIYENFPKHETVAVNKRGTLIYKSRDLLINLEKFLPKEKIIKEINTNQNEKINGAYINKILETERLTITVCSDIIRTKEADFLERFILVDRKQ